MPPRTSLILRSLFQIVGAVVVLFLFIVTVMTAIAQQEVLARMAKDDLDTGYSSAYASLMEIDERRSVLPDLRRQERQLGSRLPKLEASLQESQQRFDADWADFQPLAVRIFGSGHCELALDQTASAAGRLAVWNDVTECASANQLPPALAHRLQAFISGSQNLGTDAKTLQTADAAYAGTSHQLSALGGRIESASKLNDDERKTRSSFSAMDVLRSTWTLGGGFLVRFPPPMLQILLAFISGAFGALLITVILIVYPNSQLTLSSSARTGSRIALGGMIAMCVYIVLLGGTAVLGASESIASAGTNYMGFCAIAVLAGMFSDRVAFWLSARANAFFSTNGPAGSRAAVAGAPAQGPARAGASQPAAGGQANAGVKGAGSGT